MYARISGGRCSSFMTLLGDSTHFFFAKRNHSNLITGTVTVHLVRDKGAICILKRAAAPTVRRGSVLVILSNSTGAKRAVDFSRGTFGTKTGMFLVAASGRTVRRPYFVKKVRVPTTAGCHLSKRPSAVRPLKGRFSRTTRLVLSTTVVSDLSREGSGRRVIEGRAGLR